MLYFFRVSNTRVSRCFFFVIGLGRFGVIVRVCIWLIINVFFYGSIVVGCKGFLGFVKLSCVYIGLVIVL